MKTVFSISFIFLFIFCRTPVETSFQECSLTGIIHPVDVFPVRKLKNFSEYIILSQNLNKRTPGNELQQEGKLFSFSLLNQTQIKIRELYLKKRDEYPFHPEGVYYFKDARTVRIYILNRPVSYKSVIEVFDLKGDFLEFLYRIHLDENIKATDIYVSDTDEIYLTAVKKFTVKPGRFFYDNVNPFVIQNGLYYYKKQHWENLETDEEIFQIEYYNDFIYVLKKNKIEKIPFKEKRILLDQKIGSSIGKDIFRRFTVEDDAVSVSMKDSSSWKIVRLNGDFNEKKIIFNIYKNKNDYRFFGKTEDVYFIKKKSESALYLCR